MRGMDHVRATPKPTRAESLEQLATRRFDVLVVGGGIIGAAIAAHAARLGLGVALVDAGDFGGATSSASSKLIHGGLRYLRLGDVRLVREAHHERRTLTNVVAPALVRRIPFLLPLYEGGPYRPAAVQSGILVYSVLARSRLNWLVPGPRAAELVPSLRSDGLRSCALYADAWTNDARLCLANVRAAADAEACVVNGAEVLALRSLGGRIVGAEVQAGSDVLAVDARVVVNASGPWIDRLRRLESTSAGTSVLLSKGVHVLVPGEREWRAAVTIPQDEARVTFAVPWYGMLLLGTTDAAHDGDPRDLEATREDVEQILAEASVGLDPALLRRDRVAATFAGLRVLPATDGETSRIRRETVITRGEGGMLSVAGGKLTTYRRIALDALGLLRPDLGLHRLDRRPWPLPGVGTAGDVALPVELEPDIREHVLHLYGDLAPEMLAPALEDPALLERLHPEGPDIAAQAVYAATSEWARTTDDVVRRRTTLFYRGLVDDGVAARTAELLGRAPLLPFP
jgi:glycerol-3-phosphate dehydrogenase